jgi:hypothetical protein
VPSRQRTADRSTHHGRWPGGCDKENVSILLNDITIDGNLLVVYWRIVQGTESTVDMADKLGNLGLEVGLLRQCRGGDLNENDLAPPFRIDLQKLLECLKLVVDTLGDIELFSPDNDFLALVERSQGHSLGVDPRSITEQQL